MIKYSNYLKELITEEIHNEIQMILDGNDPIHKKLNFVTKKIKELTEQGQDPGIKDGRPKRGSSRAVIFPKDPHKIILDGQETQVPYVVKIAFPGILDKFTNSPQLLGELQNDIESDRYAVRTYSVLQPSQETDHTYHTNDEGVLVPHFGEHRDNHWLMKGLITPMTAAKFSQLTKRPSHPTGLDFDDVYNHILNNYFMAHAIRQKFPVKMSPEQLDEHPFVENLTNCVMDCGLHPGDFVMGNFGIWQHPTTQKQYPVVADHGFGGDIPLLYEEARRNFKNKMAARL